MTADAPAVGPAFAFEVVVAHELGVHVVRLKARMVRVAAYHWEWW